MSSRNLRKQIQSGTGNLEEVLSLNGNANCELRQRNVDVQAQRHKHPHRGNLPESPPCAPLSFTQRNVDAENQEEHRDNDQTDKKHCRRGTCYLARSWVGAPNGPQTDESPDSLTLSQ